MKQIINNFKEINFYNSHYKNLFINTNISKCYTPHTTPTTNYFLVKTTPIDNPELIKLSKKVCDILGISYDNLINDINIEETVSYLCGNVINNTSIPISHCYCGYQFGFFAGQLGDGRAITLGDILINKKQLYEFQLKGSGLTPYSRKADGKAVLRSSIREFLASEHLYELGIPTTRALSIVNSKSLALRDPMYNGHVIEEKCAVVCRIAPSFIRFGSFEIFKKANEKTGEIEGPSYGYSNEMLPIIIDYIIKNHFDDISENYSNGEYSEYVVTKYLRDKYNYITYPDNKSIKLYQNVLIKMFEIIVKRTGIMVGSWQINGFCHGVINTDNMSILGLTIDYGPYGIIEYYNKHYICNSSDTGGRYSFMNQFDICKWNLHKLSESLESVIDKDKLDNIINKNYEKTFNIYYYELFAKKLGYFILNKEIKILINNLLELLEDFSFDYTYFLRSLLILIDSRLLYNNNYINKDCNVRKDFINRVIEYSLNYNQKISLFNNIIPLEKLEHLSNIHERIDKTFINYNLSKSKLYNKFINIHKNKEIYESNKIIALNNWLDMFLKNHNIENKMLLNNSKEMLYLNKEKQNDINYIFEYPLDKGVFNNKLQEYYNYISESIDKINKEYNIISNEYINNILLLKHNMIKNLNNKFTLRRNLIQESIKKAEQGDYDLFNEQYKVLSAPFNDHNILENNYNNYLPLKDISYETKLSCSS